MDNPELNSEEKFILFQLGSEEYALRVEQVSSIERVLPITRVPGTAKYVKGVINLRGVVTPVIDLRSRFGMEEDEYTESTRIIIVELGQLQVGLIVDGANDVIDVPMDKVESPPEVVGQVRAEYIRGVVQLDKRLIILLDLGQILETDISELTEARR